MGSSYENSFTKTNFRAKLNGSVYIGVMNKLENSEETAIALLVINKSQYLARLAIGSIRLQTNSSIYVGYKDEEDIKDLRGIDAVYFIDLSKEYNQIVPISKASSAYLEYTDLAFFQLVQLKWQLFITLCKLQDIDRVIYSDLDVVWLSDPVNYFTEIFESDPQIQFCVQDQTFRSPLRDLCMGLFVFRANETNIETFQYLALVHATALLQKTSTGDDGIITDYYRALEDKTSIHLLPQMSFPVGSMANAFTNVGGFSKLMLKKPYIFHANYVVGERKKLLLLLIILSYQGIRIQEISIPVQIKIEYYLRRYLLSFVNIVR